MVALSVLTVGFVVLRTLLPAQAPIHVPTIATQPAPVVDTSPLVPVPPIQPWTEPPKTQLPVHPDTEPVRRLVREGTR